MITIQIIGLDHFVVGQYSRENTGNIAQLFETKEDDVSFASTETVLLHQGVEQTSWNAVVWVHAPHKFEPFEKSVATYLMKTLANFCIHVEVEFDYYEDHAHYESINSSYPRFITADQVHDISEECEEEEYDEEEDVENADPRDRADLDAHDENQIYLGNAFEGFDEKLEAARAKKNNEK
ncbi:hypothetical protein MR511_00380 [bacterium]|nr:hypothetical protein [bacterium]MDY5298665.1 hypothetical protein [Candidatus Enteromonas sp.]